MKNKKGQSEIIFLCIIFLVTAIFFLVLFKTYDVINTNMQDSDSMTNSSKVLMNTTFNMLSTGSLLDYGFFVIFFMFIVGILLLAYTVRFSAGFLVLFIILLIITVIIATQFSSAYHNIANSTAFTNASTNITAAFPMQNYIMNNLPSFMLVIGIIFAVIMYGKWYMGGVQSV